MTNPLPHVSQTTRPEASRTPAEQADVAAVEARRQNQTDEAGRPAGALPIHPTTDDDTEGLKPRSPAPTGSPKPIRDLKPGEPPPESSAGS